MKKAIEATQAEFESSSSKTPEYLAWHKLFKKEFTKFLTNKGASNIVIGKPNHFDMSGFFTLGNTIWYFSISDLRGFKDTMLIRTAKHYQDYTGGTNQYLPLSTVERFEINFDKIINCLEEGTLLRNGSVVGVHPYVANTIATMGSWK
jgi:hypothetical protein